MNEVFLEYLDKLVIVYIDDILVYSDTWEEHFNHIRKVSQVRRKEKLNEKE